MAQNSKKNKFKVYVPLGIVIIAVLSGTWYWYRDYSRYITTDDARIDADNITISSKILGRIVNIYTQEGDTVAKGKLLAELDSSDLIAQRNQAMALKIQALANLDQVNAKYASGNFTKVTQRIPARISIDSADNGKDISSFNPPSRKASADAKARFNSSVLAP